MKETKKLKSWKLQYNYWRMKKLKVDNFTLWTGFFLLKYVCVSMSGEDCVCDMEHNVTWIWPSRLYIHSYIAVGGSHRVQCFQQAQQRCAIWNLLVFFNSSLFSFFILSLSSSPFSIFSRFFRIHWQFQKQKTPQLSLCPDLWVTGAFGVPISKCVDRLPIVYIRNSLRHVFSFLLKTKTVTL